MYRNEAAEALAERGLYRRAATLYRKDAMSWKLDHAMQESAIAQAHRMDLKALEKRRAHLSRTLYTLDFGGGHFSGRYNGYSFNSVLAMRGRID